MLTSADWHGAIPEDIPECDLLIIAGDLGPMENHEDTYHAAWFDNLFLPFLESVPAKKVIAVAGNHDFYLQTEAGKTHMNWLASRTGDKFLYLEDNGTEFDGLKIHGSPWVPDLRGWAFCNPDDERLRVYWEKIPYDVDILITHGPPIGMGDQVSVSHVGSSSLRARILNLNPKLHCFGHIHEGYGLHGLPGRNTIFASCSHMDRDYEPVNPPMEFDV